MFASALCVIMLVITLTTISICAASARNAMSSRSASAVAAAVAGRPRPIALTTLGVRLLTSVAYVISVLLALAILSPVAVSFWVPDDVEAMGTASEVVPAGRRRRRRAAGSSRSVRRRRPFFTSLWYRYVFRVYGRTILFTLQLAVVSVVITTLIGVAASYALVGTGSAARRSLKRSCCCRCRFRELRRIALIQAHTTLRPTWYIILVGHLLYTMPFMIRAVTNTLRSSTSWRSSRRRPASARPGGSGCAGSSCLISSMRFSLARSWSSRSRSASSTRASVEHADQPELSGGAVRTYNLDSFQVSSAATMISWSCCSPRSSRSSTSAGASWRRWGRECDAGAAAEARGWHPWRAPDRRSSRAMSVFGPTHEALRQTVRGFVEKSWSARRRVGGSRPVRPLGMATTGRARLLGIEMPEAYGGAGRRLPAHAVFCEELARCRRGRGRHGCAGK